MRCLLPKDERVLQDPHNPFGCFADDELLRLQNTRAQDQPADHLGDSVLDIVLLGDSVLASDQNAEGERLADLLPQAVSAQFSQNAVWAHKRVRVFSYSKSAARAADQWAAIEILVDRLGRTPKGLRDVVVVVGTNPLFFSRRFSAESMNYPCLSYRFADRPELQQQLGLPITDRGLWGTSDAVLGKLGSRLYLFQQRRRIAEHLFGGPIRPFLRQKLTDGFRKLQGRKEATVSAETRNLPWFRRVFEPDSFVAHYDFVPQDSPRAWNWLATRKLFAYLGSQLTFPVLVMVTPHNHFLAGPLAETESYQLLHKQLAELARAQNIRFADYDQNPALRSEHFIDIDHENLDGNRVLAGLLAKDIAALVAQGK